MRAATGIDEWRAMWPLPIVAMLGIAGSGLYSFSSGVFMDELIRAFGWSRTEFSSAMTAYVVISLFCLPLVGRAIDRFGPRAVALAGLLPTIIGISMLGLANGNIWQWRLLVAIQAAGLVIIAAPVWITAVVSRFRVSRGLAIAVALAGSGFGSAAWPMLAAFYVEHLGWRLAYGAVALNWGLVMAPLTLFVFFGAKDMDKGPAVRAEPRPPIGHILRSRAFLCLAASGGIFICATYGVILHLVPILRWSGFDLSTAAMVAGVAGTCSIVGRIGTGFLLDIVPTRLFGILVFLLPIGASLLVLHGGGALPAAIGAAVILGLAMGAETDVVTYIASRRFDHAIFGSVYAVIQSVFAVLSVGGSILAGMLFDMADSYAPVLLAVIPMSLLGAVLFALVPQIRGDAVRAEGGARREPAVDGAAAGTRNPAQSPG